MQDRPSPQWRSTPLHLNRRTALAGFAAGVASVAVPDGVLAQPPGACVLTPDSGEGPFYFDPRLVRADVSDGRPGAPLEMGIQVLRDGDCAILTGARVDLWQADALGLYSGYERQSGTGEPGGSVQGETFLRGTQLTDAGGRVQFRTIYPSWYRGRTPHVHFKIFLEGREFVSSQIFFPDEVNERVFARFAPYRDRRDRRDTFNATDTFLTGRTGGVFCRVDEREGVQRAELVVAIRRS